MGTTKAPTFIHSESPMIMKSYSLASTNLDGRYNLDQIEQIFARVRISIRTKWNVKLYNPFYATNCADAKIHRTLMYVYDISNLTYVHEFICMHNNIKYNFTNLHFEKLTCKLLKKCETGKLNKSPRHNSEVSILNIDPLIREKQVLVYGCITCH